MGFHIKDDFKAGAPISSVPASWFNKVGTFLNNLVGGYGARVTKSDDGHVSIDFDPNAVGIADWKGNSPTTVTDNDDEREGETVPASLDPSGKDEIWKCGTDNGYVEDALVMVKHNEEAGTHEFWWVKKEYTGDGRLLRVRKYSDGGGLSVIGA